MNKWIERVTNSKPMALKWGQQSTHTNYEDNTCSNLDNRGYQANRNNKRMDQEGGCPTLTVNSCWSLKKKHDKWHKINDICFIH